MDAIRKVLSALAVLALAGAGPVVARSDGIGSARVDEPVFDYAREADAVVLRYVQILGEIGEDDRGPSVTLFGDGRVVVHYPAYMRRAGDYVLSLNEDEMRQILRFTLAQGLIEFDPEAIRRRQLELLEERRQDLSAGAAPRFFAVADAETTHLELTLEHYRPAGVIGERLTPMAKTISWYGLGVDVERFPEIRALRELYEIETMLRGLMTRPDLERVGG